MDGKLTVAEMKQIWGFKKQDGGTLAITGYKGTDTEIEIPGTIGKNTVTAIGSGALGAQGGHKSKEVVKVLGNITKITLPDTIEYIGDKAFYGDEHLAEMVIPDSVVEIGDHAFNGCGFEALTLPDSVKKIGYGAFGFCCKLKQITLPNGIEEIPNNAFNGCVNLTSAEIPDSVRIIGRDAFNGCRGLERIVIPNGVEEMGHSVFANCWNLRTVIIPDSVKVIGVDDTGSSPLTIFLGCKNVTAIVGPGSNAEKYCMKYRIQYRNSEE